MLATKLKDESSEFLRTVWQFDSGEGERNALGQAEIHRRGTIILARECEMRSSNARARKFENQMRKIKGESLNIYNLDQKRFFKVLS